jgi:hypothetical protein
VIKPHAIPAIRRGLLNMIADAKARREVAERLIEKSAWWYDHPSGKTRAPNHCERISDGVYGLELGFGANRFLVGKAVSECASQLDALLAAVPTSDSNAPSPILSEIHKIAHVVVRPVLRRCVMHQNGETYACYGNAEDDFMYFGAQAINVPEFIDEFLKICQLRAVWLDEPA